MSILWIAYGSHREARCIPGPAVHASRLPSAVYDARAGHASTQIVRDATRTRADVRANTVGAYHRFSGTGGGEGTRGATSNPSFSCATRKGRRGSRAQSPRGSRSVTGTCSVGAVDQGPTRPSGYTGTLGRQANWREVSEFRTRPLRIARRTRPSRRCNRIDFRATRLRPGFQATVGRLVPFFTARATGLGLETAEIITIFDIENGDAFRRSWRFCPSYKPIKAAAKTQFPTGRKFAKKIFIEFPTGRKLGKNRIDIYYKYIIRWRSNENGISSSDGSGSCKDRLRPSRAGAARVVPGSTMSTPGRHSGQRVSQPIDQRHHGGVGTGPFGQRVANVSPPAP